MFTSALATIGELAPRGREGRYMGLFMVSFTSGFGIGPLIGGILKDSVGVDAAFLTLAGAAVFALLLVAALMPSQSAIRRTDEEIAAIAPVRDMFRDFRVAGPVCLQLHLWPGHRGGHDLHRHLYERRAPGERDHGGAGGRLPRGSCPASSSLFSDGWPTACPGNTWLRSAASLLAVATAAIPLSPTVTALLVVFLLLGLAESAAMPASMAITTDLGRVYGYGTLIGSHQRHTGLWSSGRLLGEQRC